MQVCPSRQQLLLHHSAACLAAQSAMALHQHAHSPLCMTQTTCGAVCCSECVAVHFLLSLSCKVDLDLTSLATGIKFLQSCMSPTMLMPNKLRSMMFSCAIQVAPAMFEEEEQEQEVTPLKAALEEAVSAAEAQGRSRQPGEATALLALGLQFCTVCLAVISAVRLLLRSSVSFPYQQMLERASIKVMFIFAVLQYLCNTMCGMVASHAGLQSFTCSCNQFHEESLFGTDSQASMNTILCIM